MERITRSGLFGPWDKPDLDYDQKAAGINPAGCDPWGLDSLQIFPNFTILVWGQSWYLDLPLLADRSQLARLRRHAVLRAGEDAAERVAHELAAVSFKEYGLQDANTLEATQTMLESRVVERFPLNDQEVLCRHLHKVVGGVGRRVQEARRGRGLTDDADDAAGRVRRPRALSRHVVPADRKRAIRPAPGRPDGRDAGVLRRDHAASRGGDDVLRLSSRSTTCPRTR